MKGFIMTIPYVDFEYVKQVSLVHLEEICRKLLPNGQKKGVEWECGSINGEAGKSFKVNLKTGLWSEFNGGEPSGGDAISLLAAIYQIEQKEAAIKLLHMLGLDKDGYSSQAKAKFDDNSPWQPNRPEPFPEEIPDFRNQDEFKTVYKYKDVEGNVILAIVRLDEVDQNGQKIKDERGKERKTFRPLSWNGKEWNYQSILKPWPLYNQDILATNPNASVLVVEGEKCADAANKLFPTYVSTCWPNGAGSWGSVKADLLKGRNVLLWPDNDLSGKNSMNSFGSSIAKETKSLCIIDLEKLAKHRPNGSRLPDGWDIADAVNEGWPIDAILQAIETAKNPIRIQDVSLSKVELLSAKDIVPEAIEWIWPDYLAKGKLHIIAGKPASGKTTLAIEFAAIISRGGEFPDGSIAQARNVLIWSSEDAVSDTLVPRLTLAKADMSKVFFVGGKEDANGKKPFDPSKDMEDLEKAATNYGDVELLILDPIVMVVKGDGHNNTDTRKSLQPVVDLADRIGCAVLGITHFTKGTIGNDPVERITGSIAFGAVTRMAFIATKSELIEGESSKRLFTRAKSSFGPDGGGFYYDIQSDNLESHPDITTSKIVWKGKALGTARQLLDGAERISSGTNNNAISSAIFFLKTELENGPIPAKEMLERAKDAGISTSTLNRAKAKIGILSKKNSSTVGNDSTNWVWQLPKKAVIDPFDCLSDDEECHVSQATNLDNLESLGDEFG